jgi:hypothetical protein
LRHDASNGEWIDRSRLDDQGIATSGEIGDVSMFRISIRELLMMMVIVALAVGWRLDIERNRKTTVPRSVLIEWQQSCIAQLKQNQDLEIKLNRLMR